MQIDFISDTICPWCFIGKRRLARAMAMRPNIIFDVRYRPYRLDSSVPRVESSPRVQSTMPVRLPARLAISIVPAQASSTSSGCAASARRSKFIVDSGKVDNG